MRIQKPTPDNLDPIFEAHRCLKAIFDAAEAIEYELGEVNGVMHTDVMLRLPGSGEIVDPNDLNPLNGLERWLAEHVAGQVEERE